MKRICSEHPEVVLAIGLAAGLLLSAPSARANVYASHVRVNGGVTNVTANPGDSVSISYILNEPASRGVTVDILLGSTSVRKLSYSGNGPGTDRGLNTVVWDLRDSSSNTVPAGAYAVKITAAAEGYAEWTQISSESDPNTYVYDGRGIAVDADPASPYFGRVVVANSAVGNDPSNTPGDVLGLLKFNADGSGPADGITSTGGRTWPGNELGPWKAESAEGLFYVNDLALNGQVFRWDPTISSNSLTAALQQSNVPAGASLAGLGVVRQGTNTQLWMADRLSNYGVLKWTLDSNGICVAGDTGTTVVGLSGSPTNLALPPQDVAVDHGGNIYVCQAIPDHANPDPRVFRYRAYDPSTNGGLPALEAEWAVGGGDDTYGGASGIAVDPTGTYVAVSFQGVTVSGLIEGGNTKVLYATNGALAANIDLDLVIQGDPTHQDTDCAWDAAGNVYYIDNWWGRWRAVSPPGTNQMSTTALASILVTGTDTNPPAITGISLTNGFVVIRFTGSASDSPGSFVVLASPSLTAPYEIVQTAVITSSAPGLFTAVAPASGSTQFFKIERRGGTTPVTPAITRIALSSGTVGIRFTAAATDSPSAFTLLSAPSPNGAYGPESGAQITVAAPGVFQATTLTNGPARYYRIQR